MYTWNDTDEIPPVLPHELSRIDMREFVKHLQSQRELLLPRFGTDGIDGISKDFAEFQRALREEPQTGATKKTCQNQKKYGRFSSLVNAAIALLRLQLYSTSIKHVLFSFHICIIKIQYLIF